MVCVFILDRQFFVFFFLKFYWCLKRIKQLQINFLFFTLSGLSTLMLYNTRQIASMRETLNELKSEIRNIPTHSQSSQQFSFKEIDDKEEYDEFSNKLTANRDFHKFMVSL